MTTLDNMFAAMEENDRIPEDDEQDEESSGKEKTHTLPKNPAPAVEDMLPPPENPKKPRKGWLGF